jgi:hypothetical protein
MASVIYLTRSAASQMAADLRHSGVTVWEALWVSEVLYLCEHEHIDVAVIAPDVDEPELAEVQIRHATMRLEAKATTGHVVWELAHL